MDDQPVAVAPAEGLHKRKGSVAAVELWDSEGHRRTMALDDMSDADRELAEKYGYKPVSWSNEAI
jgi:hypothetical protein